MNFTQAQQQAIRHTNGPCLVLAVPGAGKTTVLIERLAHLVRSGVPSEQIASITFSKQQALDMRRRFQERFPHCKIPLFSTIHAFCYRILQNHAASCGETLHLIENSAEYNKNRVLARLFNELVRRPITEEELEDFFRIDSYLKNALLDYSEYSRHFKERFPHFVELSQAYTSFKRLRALIDFDDMLLHTLSLLTEQPTVLEKLRAHFSYLQLDEAQDTSLVQFRIVQLLAAPKNNLFLVADDDQAIYGFRGADPSYLLHFREFYPDAQILMMQDNHRSSKNIVHLSGNFIRGNRARFSKLPTTDSSEEQRILILMAKTAKAQYQRILRELPNDLERGSCAILFRNNLSLIALMDVLERAGYTFTCRFQTATFYRHPILRDLFDFYHVAKDPTDLASFRRIYYKLNSYLKKEFIVQASAMDGYESVFDRIRACDGALNSFYREKLLFLERQFYLLSRENLSGGLIRIQRELGYGEYLRERARRKNTAVDIDQRTLETLSVLVEGMTEPRQLEHRLSQLLHLQKASAEEWQPLFLSTIHGAKGLEFDTVWVIDLLQNEFPSTVSLDLAQEGNSSLLEEERRLFYVAMTRAKKQLRLIGRKSVNTRPCEPSQFLRELTEKKEQ